MLHNLLWIAVTVVMALLQTTWPDFLTFQGVTPELTLMLVVYFAIVEGEERAMFTGTVGGIYQDVASKVLLGHNVLCLVVIGYAVGRLSTRLVTDHPAVKAGLVFLAGLAQGMLYTMVLDVQLPETRVMRTVLMDVVPSAFYTALLTPLVFFVLSRIFRERPSPQGNPA